MSKREIVRSVKALSSDAQFAIVYGEIATRRNPAPAYSQRKYPANGVPVAATGSSKSRAAAFLNQRRPDAPGYLVTDIAEGLKSAEKLDGKDKVLIYVGDGLVYDPARRLDYQAALAEIRALNKRKVKINTVGVNPYRSAEEFLIKLAAQNGGKYRRVGSLQSG